MGRAADEMATANALRKNGAIQAKGLIRVASAEVNVLVSLTPTDARKLDLAMLAWRDLGSLSQNESTRAQAFASLARVLDCFPLLADM